MTGCCGLPCRAVGLAIEVLVVNERRALSAVVTDLRG